MIQFRNSRHRAWGFFLLFVGYIQCWGASPYGKVENVALTEVRWTGGFWAERMEVCRSNMVPGLWKIMEGTNYSQFYQNFRIAAGLAEGKHRGAPFNDGDFYKWLEAACACLATHPD